MGDLKRHYDNHDIKQFYAVADRELRIKHGNPVVKVLLGEEGEVTDDMQEVSKKIAEFFQGVYKKRGDEPAVTCTWTKPNTEDGEQLIVFTG
jgi:hypothetical protein